MSLQVIAASAVVIVGLVEGATSIEAFNWSRRRDSNPRSWIAPPCKGDRFSHFPTSANSTNIFAVNRLGHVSGVLLHIY